VLTVMGIALAAAIPHWVAIENREREAELIARGFQYAEAIRVFQQRFGRLPNRLKELVEVEPRTIRQLWKDPMTDGESFLVLMEVGSGQVLPIDPETGQIVVNPPATEPPEEGDNRPQGGRQPQPGRVKPEPPPGNLGPDFAAPIHGVKSRARGESYRSLFGQSNYGDWEFTVERLIAATTAKNSDGLLRRVDYSTIGKGFRYPPPGGIPGANLPPPGQGGGQPRPPQPLPGQAPPSPQRQPPGGQSGRGVG